MSGISAVLLTEIISPYRIKPFNHLSRVRGLDLEVYFLAETEDRRHWKVRTEEIRFRYEVLPGIKAARMYQGGTLFFNPSVVRRLVRRRPDVVICAGWSHPTTWVALLAARLIQARVLVWSESTLQDSRVQSRVKEAIKRWVVRNADGYVVPGSAQREYLRFLGAAEDRIRIAPNAVDNDHFAVGVDRGSEAWQAAKRELGLEGLVVLYVGRLLDEKGIPELLRLAPSIERDFGATLVLVGTGPEEERYRAECVGAGLRNVHFAGFQDQERITTYYAAADVFVFPTRSDPWGLVVNEAMAAGLPVVCSTAAGAAGDLVEDGGNGFLCAPGDEAELGRAVARLLRDAGLRTRMGRRSAEIIQSYSPERMADGFASAIFGAVGSCGS